LLTAICDLDGVLDLTTQGIKPELLAAAGLPVGEAEKVLCGSIDKPCSPEDTLKGVASQRPITLPFSTPLYSNMNYVLLGLVLERVTNKTYVNAVRDLLFEPLGLQRTSASLPTDKSNSIDPGMPASLFAVDLGTETA